MALFVDYFKCDECGSIDFKRIYNFSLRFYNVNFSDELIYDRNTSEIYQCTGCKKRFSAEEIEKGLAEIKKMRRQQKSST
ncbi:MAG: hypothetical protein ACLFUE_05820 [Desulfobacteraceae bacterium]